jgi:DNA polymerase-3 subunit gamma/tau
LLRLIEQISEIETSIRWASNKKLHLEIALIRGIQTLGEVSLESVIDALEDLRGPGSGSPTSGVSNERTPPAQKSTRLAADYAPGVETRRQTAEPIDPADKGPDPMTAAAPESLTISAPPVANTPSVPTTELEEQSEVPSPSLDSSWLRVLQEVSSSRPLVLSWIENAIPLRFESGTLTLGFPKDRAVAVESLSRANTRAFLEEICGEILGQACKLQFELKDGLTPISKPAAPKPVDPMEDFKNDPLIQKALELFKAEIQAEA